MTELAQERSPLRPQTQYGKIQRTRSSSTGVWSLTNPDDDHVAQDTPVMLEDALRAYSRYELLASSSSPRQRLAALTYSRDELEEDEHQLQMTLDVFGEIKKTSQTGDGPVDATFKCIKALYPHDMKLLLYQVHAVTEGTDAQATVSVKIEENDRSTVGQSADTDTLVASANAYLNALNKMLIKREANTIICLTLMEKAISRLSASTNCMNFRPHTMLRVTKQLLKTLSIG